MHLKLSRIALVSVVILALTFVASPTSKLTNASSASNSTNNIVINGDFETPFVSWRGVRYSAGQSFDGWTIQTGSVDQMGENYWQNARGSQSIDLNGSYDSIPGSMYQDLGTQPGETYKLIFSMSGNPDGMPTIKEMKIWWGASLINTLTFDITGHTKQTMGWASYEYRVLAVSDTTRLKFESLLTGVYGPLVDNIQVIPETNRIYLPFVAVPRIIQAATPFLTQMGSAGVAGSGSNNCGPASVAMTINRFGGTITVEDAAIAIRGSNTSSNGPTNFKGSSTIQLLSHYGLSTKDINTYNEVQQENSLGHPIVILVNNTIYRDNNPPPYANNNNGWFVTNHIVVVTGYDANYVYSARLEIRQFTDRLFAHSNAEKVPFLDVQSLPVQSIYINDPLRYISASLPDPANYAVPIAIFKNAASSTPSSSASSWYAISVFK